MQNTTDEGWTTIRPRKGRRSRTRPQPAPVHVQAHAEPLRSVASIAAEHHATRCAWETSPYCLSLRQLVAKANASAGRVSRAICLGIGSFDGGWEATRRTHLQLAAFLVMVRELERGSRLTIPCFFQEPIFTAADRDFIVSLGHRVVDSPEGCDRVTSDSFLFGIHLYRPVYALALSKDLPAIFVGTGWDVWDQVSPSVSHDLDNLEKMEETYEKAAFPQEPSGTAFSSTSVYWRRPSLSTTDEARRDATTNQEHDLAVDNESTSIT